MKNKLKVRKAKTASGASAIQIIKYKNGKRIIIRHIGSAHTDEELSVLIQEAETICEQLCSQLTFFSIMKKPQEILNKNYLQLSSVTHCFALTALRNVFKYVD